MYPSFKALCCFCASVPLQSISVAVAIKGFVADVVSELHYKNEEKIPLEVEFVFPLDADAAVYAFEGLMGETKIEAQIMEKEQAQALYEDRLAMLEASVLFVRDPKSRDIFKCMLGNLPPSGEATLKLCYVQALAPEPDGAVRFVLPVVLNPRYALQGKKQYESHCLFVQDIPRVPERELPYKLSLSATLHSPYGISHVKSNCTLTPLQYATEDHTTAQISLTEGYCLNRDVELLIYYKEVVRKPSLLLEVGKPGADPGSLMGDHVLLLTLYPSPPAPKPGLNTTGEFLFLMDCSSSMSYSTRSNSEATTRIQSAKETLIFLLKSLPLGCYFNIYAFGSSYYSFYRKSVKYTQQTMLESLRGVLDLQANLGGTEILQPLKLTLYTPIFLQVFVFTDGEVSNIDEVIAEVQSHSKSHRCFSFGIGEGTSSYFIGGIAEASGGRAEFIRSKEQMQAKALRSLKCSLQPEVKHIKLEWHLPPGLEAVLLGSSTQAIFAGERCLMYAQICGQQQASRPNIMVGYIHTHSQTFTEKMDFRLEAEENDRLPVHRLAAQAVLKELEETRSTAKQQLVLETSLSSGVLSAQTAYVVVNMERGEPLQAPVEFREIPYPNSTDFPKWGGWGRCPRPPSPLRNSFPKWGGWGRCPRPPPPFGTAFRSGAAGADRKNKGNACKVCNFFFIPSTANESLLLRLVSLQNADGSWSLDANLLSILGLGEVLQTAWTTVLVVLWLHVHFAERSDIWQLLEAKAVGWLHESTGEWPKLAECVKAGNTFLGCDVSAEVFGL
uniref:von Willebrand factor A domain containing 5A n=1 Tax=Podarcis muralis TaxID=64176 RepID=A0A670JIJ7_PODMU